MVRVVLVEMHPAVAASVRRLLSRHADLDIAGELAHSHEAVRRFADSPPDAVILGMHNGCLHAVRELLGGLPGARLVVFGPGDAPQYAEVCLAWGASAFVSYADAEDELPKAVRRSSPEAVVE